MLAQEEPLGSQLIGELEGPVVLVDAPRPASLKQAPMLDELVQAGTLPPVEQRVPEEPLVIKPLEEIGKYGGTLRRGFTGPGDDENGNRYVSGDKLVFWDYTGTEFRPALAKSWEFSDGDRIFTIQLRKGHKWSDGAPFTADDFVFWYEDIYLNKDLVPTPHASFAINGKQGEIEKVDETTVRFVFEEPYPLFLTILGGTTFMGSGHMTNRGFHGGAYAPAHYLKQFLPQVHRRRPTSTRWPRRPTSRTGSPCSSSRTSGTLNPDLPMLGPWRTVQPINTPTWVLERNPYYYEVDTEGNQLPYIDKHPDDAGREPGGAQPARDRRRVRPPGAPHRHRQAAGLPGEPGEGRLQRPSRPRRLRLGRHAAGQPELRRRSRDRQVAPATATSATRSRWASTATSSTRPSGSASASPATSRRPRTSPLQPRPGVAHQVGDAATSSRPTSCSTGSA